MKNARCARSSVKSALFWCLSFALIISNLFIVSKLSYVRAEETNTKQEYFDLGFTKENHDFKGSARVNENKTVDLLFDFSHWSVFQEEALLRGVKGDWNSGSPLVSDASRKTYTGQLSFEDAKSLKDNGFKIYLPKLGNDNGWFPKVTQNGGKNAMLPESLFDKITETEKRIEEKEKKEEEAGPKEPEADHKEPEAGPTPPAAGSTPPETEKQEDSPSEEPGKTEEVPAVPGTPATPGTPGTPEKGEPEAKEEAPSVPDSGKKEEAPEAGKSEEAPSSPKVDKEEVSPEQAGKETEQPGKPAEQPDKKEEPSEKQKPEAKPQPEVKLSSSIFLNLATTKDLTKEARTTSGKIKVNVDEESAKLVGAKEIEIKGHSYAKTAGFNPLNHELYDISLLDKDGNKITEFKRGFEAEVLLPVKSGREVLAVKHFLDPKDSTKQEKVPSEEVEIAGQKYRKIKVSHFSVYGIEYKPVSEGKDKLPDTGASTAASSALVMLMGIGLAFFTKKK